MTIAILPAFLISLESNKSDVFLITKKAGPESLCPSLIMRIKLKKTVWLKLIKLRFWICRGMEKSDYTEAVSKVMHAIFLLPLFLWGFCSQSFSIVSLLLSDWIPTFGKHYYFIQNTTFFMCRIAWITSVGSSSREEKLHSRRGSSNLGITLSLV